MNLDVFSTPVRAWSTGVYNTLRKTAKNSRNRMHDQRGPQRASVWKKGSKRDSSVNSSSITTACKRDGSGGLETSRRTCALHKYSVPRRQGTGMVRKSCNESLPVGGPTPGRMTQDTIANREGREGMRQGHEDDLSMSDAWRPSRIPWRPSRFACFLHAPPFGPGSGLLQGTDGQP